MGWQLLVSSSYVGLRNFVSRLGFMVLLFGRDMWGYALCTYPCDFVLEDEPARVGVAVCVTYRIGTLAFGAKHVHKRRYTLQMIILFSSCNLNKILRSSGVFCCYWPCRLAVRLL